MTTAMAPPGNTRTWLVHTFGCGLDGEDRFVVERFKTMLDGDIRPVHPEAPKAKGRRNQSHPTRRNAIRWRWRGCVCRLIRLNLERPVF